MAKGDSSRRWRKINAFDGYWIEVDDTTHEVWIWSNRRGGWKRLNPCTNKVSGYLDLRLTQDKKLVCVRVHQVVCRAFHGEPMEGEEVCHRDGNKSHNHPDNLRWGSRSSNMQDRAKHGMVYPSGEDHPNTRLTQKDVDEIRRLYSQGRYTQKELARRFGSSQSRVSGMVTGKNWTTN